MTPEQIILLEQIYHYGAVILGIAIMIYGVIVWRWGNEAGPQGEQQFYTLSVAFLLLGLVLALWGVIT